MITPVSLANAEQERREVTDYLVSVGTTFEEWQRKGEAGEEMDAPQHELWLMLGSLIT